MRESSCTRWRFHRKISILGFILPLAVPHRRAIFAFHTAVSALATSRLGSRTRRVITPLGEANRNCRVPLYLDFTLIFGFLATLEPCVGIRVLSSP
jgi:hypothetical protein